MAAAGGGGGMRPAVFLDRDGTIITSVHYLADPELVRLIDGAAEGDPGPAIGRIRDRRGQQPVGRSAGAC